MQSISLRIPLASALTASLIIMSIELAGAFDRTSPAHSILVGAIRVPEEPILRLTNLALPEGHELRISHIKSDSSDFYASGVVEYIEATDPISHDPSPRMPQLRLRLENLDPQLVVNWQMTVDYTRPSGRDLPQDHVRFPDNGTIALSADKDWDVCDLYKNLPFFGGNATVFFTVCKDGQCGPEHTYRFQIGGRNPDEKSARQYIDRRVRELADSSDLPPLWYAYAVAKHETKEEAGKKEAPYYVQFLPLGYKPTKKHPNPPPHPDFGAPNWNDDGRYARGKKKGQIKPGGYGLFQVTGFNDDSDANIPDEVIWNWQKNVDAGLDELVRWEARAITYVRNLRKLTGIPMPPLKICVKTGDLIFAEDGPKKISDLVAMKMYNAESYINQPDPDREPPPEHYFYHDEVPTSGHFVYWRDDHAHPCKYSLSRYSSEKRVYVEKVCLEVEQ